MKKLIIYNGKTYESKKELWENECTCGILYETFNRRLKNGWSIDDALHITPSNYKSIIYNNNVYPTLKSLWKYECSSGIPYNKFTKRLYDGWSIDDALHKLPKDSIEYNGKIYKDKYDLWKKESVCGISYKIFYNRLNSGYSLQTSLGISPFLMKDAINFAKNNKKYDLIVTKRIKQGQDIFECYIENPDGSRTFKIMSYDMIDQYCFQKYKENRDIN